jgi:hypothetical protein
MNQLFELQGGIGPVLSMRCIATHLIPSWHRIQRTFEVCLLTAGSLVFAATHACGAEQSLSGLSISITGAKPHLSVGQSFSLVAKITNNTPKVIYLNEEFLRLKVPMEFEGPNSTEAGFWYGTLIVGDARPDARNKENNYHLTVPLRPGDGTPVWFFWNRKELGCASSHGMEFLEAFASSYRCAWFFLFFVPGTYQATVTADYWIDPTRVGDPDPWRSVETANLDVAAPLWVILFGAVIGGLIAYRILPQRNQGGNLTPGRHLWLIKAGAFLGTILLSVIVAILWARLSDFVTPIRLTITDLWGGIAIGFVGNYYGLGLLGKITKSAAAAKPGQAEAAAP